MKTLLIYFAYVLLGISNGFLYISYVPMYFAKLFNKWCQAVVDKINKEPNRYSEGDCY